MNLNPTDLDQSSLKTCFPHSGFLTPISASHETRRDSIISLQSSASSSCAHSFMSVPSGGSSAYCSPQLPATPTSQRDLANDDYVLINGQNPFGCGSPRIRTASSLEDLHEPSMTMNDNEMTKPNIMPFTSDPDWIHVAGASGDVSPTLGGMDQVLHPAAADYGTSVHPIVPRRALQGHLLPPAEVFPSTGHWGTCSAQMPSYMHSVVPYSNYDMAHSMDNTMSYSWPTPSIDSFGHQFSDAPSATIMPADSVLKSDDHSFMNMNSDDLEEPLSAYEAYTSEEPSSPLDHFSGIKSEPCHRETSRHSGRGRVEHFTTRTGGKGVKKERRSSRGITKRKPKPRCANEYFATLPGKEDQIKLQVQGGIKKMPNGKWAGTGEKSEKQKCFCGKGFERQEHLKRHQNTVHTGGKEFGCDIPGCEKEIEIDCGDGRTKRKVPTSFNRNDNREAHYLTHLERDKNGLFFPPRAAAGNSGASLRRHHSHSHHHHHHQQHQNHHGGPAAALGGIERPGSATSTSSTTISIEDKKPGARNKRYSWDRLCQILREVKAPDEVEKLIQSVERKAKGHDEKTRRDARKMGKALPASAGRGM